MLAVGAGGGCLDSFSLIYHFSFLSPSLWVEWLVGCFGLNGPLRQYFSLYQAVSQRQGEREGRDESKRVQTTPPAPTASAVGPCPTVIQSVGRPGTVSLFSTIPTTPKRGRKIKVIDERKKFKHPHPHLLQAP